MGSLLAYELVWAALSARMSYCNSTAPFRGEELRIPLICSGLRRLKEMCDLVVSSLNMRLLVDAEYTYMNVGIAAVALALMVVYNKEQPMVGSTYQCYLKVKMTIVTLRAECVMYNSRLFSAKRMPWKVFDNARGPKLSSTSLHNLLPFLLSYGELATRV